MDADTRRIMDQFPPGEKKDTALLMLKQGLQATPSSVYSDRKAFD